MSQWNLIIDVARCENCNNCVLANKDEYVGNDFLGYTAGHDLHGESTIKIHRRVRGQGHMVDAAYLPAMCNHCDDAPCIKAGAGAVSKRADGIVVFDPIKTKGRKDLVDSCPYGAVVWNEKALVPQNWIFDAHLLDQGWKEPRCAQSCPTEAIRALKTDTSEMARLATEQKLEVLKPEFGTKPRVYYRNLHRYMKHFVGGSVVARTGTSLECVEGAKVVLNHDGRALQQTRSDAFGDFKFDGLSETSGLYQIQVAHPDRGVASVDAIAGTTTVLGDIELQPLAVAA